MPVSYAGVYLPSCTPEVAAHIEQRLCLGDVVEFEDRPWGYFDECLTWDWWTYGINRPIKVGHLWWPHRAQLFAVAHFVVDDNLLGVIRGIALAGGELTPQPLVISGGNGVTVTAQKLYMLPARPISDIDGANSLKLLTLVDERYWWFFQNTGAMPLQTDWNALIAYLATVSLGILVSLDPIPAIYLDYGPSPLLSKSYFYPTVLLDAAAYNLGMRFCAHLDGTFWIQNATSALNQDAANINNTTKLLGGQFAL